MAFEADETLAAQALVAAGVGVTLLPRLALTTIHPGVVARALSDRPRRSIWAARLEGAYSSPASEAMLQILADVAEEFRETAARARRPVLTSRSALRSASGGAAEVVALGVVRARARASSSSVSCDSTPSAIVSMPKLRATSTIALHHLAVGRAGLEVAHELDVDLEVVDRQVLEVGEAAVAGAEVVEREAAAERCQPLGQRAGLVDVLRRGGLGDLEHEVARVGARVARAGPR